MRPPLSLNPLPAAVLSPAAIQHHAAGDTGRPSRRPSPNQGGFDLDQEFNKISYRFHESFPSGLSVS
jgi:hypothetical protein